MWVGALFSNTWQLVEFLSWWYLLFSYLGELLTGETFGLELTIFAQGHLFQKMLCWLLQNFPRAYITLV